MPTSPGPEVAAVEPLRRQSLSEQVAGEIRHQIWTGRLRGGDRLAQEELAESMGVSRIPVREALIALTHEGAIRMATHRGAFVEPLTEAGITDHYDLFGQVDGFALRKAIERAGDGERRQLAADMISAAGVDTAPQMQALVISTRRSFHQLGGSPRFHAVSRGLTGLVAGNFFDEVPGALDGARLRLPEVGDAVAAEAADLAVQRYETMMREHGVLVLAVLDQRGVLD
ncbi:MAG: GntR family transcriptional regulator [Acidimicrobiales bacterium]